MFTHWSKRAGGLEIKLDIAIFSADKVFIHDMRHYFENDKYICNLFGLALANARVCNHVRLMWHS